MKENDGFRVFNLYNNNRLDWKLLGFSSLDEIIKENQIIRKYVLLISILCLIISIGATYVISNTITKPILKLSDTMKTISYDDFHIRIKQKTCDEIGMLNEAFNCLMDRINKLMNKIYEEQNSVMEYKLKLLQSQINPHFLYNSLEIINSFITLNMNDKAIYVNECLANFYRETLSKGADVISLNEELKLTEDYLQIQKFRYVDYIDFSIKYTDNILNNKIPKLTLQPFVENSIYHGLKPKDSKGIISINAYSQDSIVYIEIYDNGVGIDKETIYKICHNIEHNKKREGFGVDNVDARIKVLFGDKYGIDIKSKINEFTIVTISIPQISLTEDI